jgi:Group II intron, maturase-specific domain
LGAAPAKKAVTRVKGRIRWILRPGNQAPWDEVKEARNRVLRGWGNYFAYETRFMAYRAVDHSRDADRSERAFRSSPIVLSQPKISSTRLRFHWLTT